MTEKMQASVPLGLCAVMPLFGEVNLFPTERSNIVRLRNRRFAQKLTSPDISFSADTTPEISPREASLISLLSATPSPHPENNTAANNMPANKVLLFILISPVFSSKSQKSAQTPPMGIHALSERKANFLFIIYGFTLIIRRKTKHRFPISAE